MHRDAIRTALLQGWPRAAVHSRLRDVLGMGYQQFSRYVDRYLHDTRDAHRGQPLLRPAQQATPHRPTAPVIVASPAPPPIPAPASPAPARFVYDPARQSRDNLV